MLFKQMMCFYDDQWCCSFKSYTTFNSNDGISNMDITPDGILRGNCIQLLNGIDGILEFDII